MFSESSVSNLVSFNVFRFLRQNFNFNLVKNYKKLWHCFSLQNLPYQMRPFQNEGPERSRFVPASHGKRRPLADEADEIEKPTNPKKKLTGKPFQDEASEESSGSNDDPDSNPFLPKTESVFSLGWQTVHSFQKATAWGRHQKEEDKKQKDMKKRGV